MPATFTDKLSSTASFPRKNVEANSDNDYGTQILELWVQHGLSVGSRSAVLISNLSHHHAIAIEKKSAETPIRTSMGKSFEKVSSPFRNNQSQPVLSVNIPLLSRDKLRTLRSQKKDLLKAKETKLAEEIRRKAAEAERLAREAKEKERQEKLRIESQAKQQIKSALQASQTLLPQKNSNQTSAQLQLPLTSKPIPSANLKVDKSKEELQPLTSLNQNSFPAVDGNSNPVPKISEEKSATKKEELEDLLPFVKNAKKVWEDITEAAKSFRQDPAIKRGRMHLKKKINLAVNQISATVKQVSRKVTDLADAVELARSLNRPDAEPFVLKEIAERIIYETDGPQCLNLPTVYAIAAVIVGTTASVSNKETLRDVILGQFFHHCIYTQATYGTPKKGETREEFRKRVGYRTDEPFESYLSRVNGCMSLFGAVFQTELVITRTGINQVHNPFTLDMGWAWLARMINSKPRMMTAPALFAFLDLAGYAMSRRYRQQFTKLMPVIEEVGCKKALKNAPKVSTTRLQIFVENYQKAGNQIPNPPKGRNIVAKDSENQVAL